MSNLTLAPLFRDHAVLQRDQVIPVWGRAAPGEKITVTFRDQETSTTTGADGRWRISLDPLAASDEAADLSVSGNTTIVMHDVLVGEVWLATGQSNMNRPVASLTDAEVVLAQIDQPLIRHINITPTLAESPAEDVTTSGWLIASPETAGDFSAVAWFFSAELQRRIKVPVGVIHSSWGGSNIEAWMDRPTLQNTSVWPAVGARWDHMVTYYEEIKAKHAAWQEAEEEAQETGAKNSLPQPLMPLGPGTQRQLSGLFNGMLAPLQPYAIRGNVWYQGEANWDRPDEYAVLFPAMIKAWREQWGLGDFPFYFVQLPNYTEPRDPSDTGWAKSREAQTSALELPQTAMAVTIDCGDPMDIHPQNKPIVGQRLALIAAAETYGINVAWSGPTFRQAEREGTSLRVHFEHADTGLITRGGAPQSFEIAGVDRQFHPAHATLDGHSVILHSSAVPEPVAVRYAWNNIPDTNLYNQAGFPAVPFRSEKW